MFRFDACCFAAISDTIDIAVYANTRFETEQLYHFHKKLGSKYLLILFAYDPVRIRTKLSVFDTAF